MDCFVAPLLAMTVTGLIAPTRRQAGRRRAASTSALIFAPSRFSAIARSYWLCKFSQNAAPGSPNGRLALSRHRERQRSDPD
jgi:hypothetical protein